MSNMISGKVAFSVLTSTDFYKGKDTGQYKLTVTLDDDSAEMLDGLGVHLKEYEGTQQRSFKSKHKVEVLDMDNNPFTQEIPRGSKVRVLFATGPDNAQYGVPVYMNKIRLVEAAASSDIPEDF